LPSPQQQVVSVNLELRANDAGLRRAAWDAYVCENATSHKFWRIRRAHVFMETWWGHIGTNGQTKIKEHGSERACAHAVGKLWVEKANKGYVRDRSFVQNATASTAPPAPRVPQRDPLSGRVAVYALRDVYGIVGDYGARGLVRARGQKQMLPAPIASELVTGSLDYGYWHPDDVEPPSVSHDGGEDVSGAISRYSWGVSYCGRIFKSRAEAQVGAPPSARAAPAPQPAAPAPPRRPETVPLGRFAGLADDEEEI
jgi:predicted DNA-binding WGR domain protein